MKEDNGKQYGCTQEQLAKKVKNLENIIDILNSNLDDVQKAYEIFKIYGVLNSAKKFKMAYSVIYKLGSNDVRFINTIGYYPNICEILDKYDANGYFKVAYERNKLAPYYEYYDYAKEIVVDFIRSANSHDLSFFLEEEGINKETFDFCVKTIDKLDIDLAKQYENKKNSNSYSRFCNAVSGCLDIVQGIKTGKFMDGTEFDILEFWKRVPFKENSTSKEGFKSYTEINPEILFATSFFRRMDSFTKVIMPACNPIIMDFFKENNITATTFFKELDVREKYGNRTRKFFKYETDANGNRIPVYETFVSVDDILKYMRMNKLPFIYEIFYIVEEKIKNGEIIIEDLNKNNDKGVFIPKRKLLMK